MQMRMASISYSHRHLASAYNATSQVATAAQHAESKKHSAYSKRAAGDKHFLCGSIVNLKALFVLPLGQKHHAVVVSCW